MFSLYLRNLAPYLAVFSGGGGSIFEVLLSKTATGPESFGAKVLTLLDVWLGQFVKQETFIT